MNFKVYSNNKNKPRAICLGYFDGIHLGHQILLNKTIEEAHKYNLTPTFFTFDPDPNFVLGFKDKNELIMPLVDMSVEKLFEYKGSTPCPIDFDQYWDDALAEMNSIDPKAEFIKKD